jgi:hypothetical protein
MASRIADQLRNNMHAPRIAATNQRRHIVVTVPAVAVFSFRLHPLMTFGNALARLADIRRRKRMGPPPNSS